MQSHPSRWPPLIYFDISDYYFDCAHLFSPGDKASQGAGRACQGVFYKAVRAPVTGGGLLLPDPERPGLQPRKEGI